MFSLKASQNEAGAGFAALESPPLLVYGSLAGETNTHRRTSVRDCDGRILIMKD